MKEKSEKFNKITSNNEKYSLKLKIKEQNILYMSLSFDNDNKQYEDFKLYEDIKEEQAYFKIMDLLKYLKKSPNLYQRIK